MDDFIKTMMISCTCLTKTPELKYHKEDCAYRKAHDGYFKIKEENEQFLNYKAFDPIIWMCNGSVIEFSQYERDEFNYTSLSNTDFIDFYLDSGQHLEQDVK